MGKIIMIYSLDGKDSSRIRFNRKLFNYKLQSHKGQYRTTSKGILENCEKPVRSVVIFENKYLKKVKNLVNEHKLFYKLYEIQREIR